MTVIILARYIFLASQ